MAIDREHELTRFRFLQTLSEVRRVCPTEHYTLIEFTIEEARQLFDCGEESIGLEILISNLHEVSFPVPVILVAELRWLAERLTIGPGYAGALEQLLQSTRG